MKRALSLMRAYGLKCTRIYLIVFLVTLFLPTNTDARRFRIRVPSVGLSGLATAASVAELIFKNADIADNTYYIGKGSAAFGKIDGQTVEFARGELLKRIANGHIPNTATYIIDEDAFLFEDLQYYPDEASIYVLNKDKAEAWPILKLTNNSVPEYYLNISETLLAKLENASLIRSMINIETWRLHKGDIHLLSLFDEGSLTAKTINNVANTTGVDHSALNRANMASVFEQNKDKLVVLVSHVEDGKVFARDDDLNPIMNQYFTMEELQNQAQKNNVYLMILGCNSASFSRGRGFQFKVNSMAVAEQLERALQAENFLDFLKNIGTKDIPLLIDDLIFDQEQMLMKARAVKLDKASKVATGITTVTLLSSTDAFSSTVVEDAEASIATAGNGNNGSDGDSKDNGWPWWSYVIGVVVGLYVLGRVTSK